ncbi:hypothetical protein GCM10010406_52400 [Streptomyces thermolineatus]|uniref:LTD domain-containing protein n=1 Tax=Streptomyces thermolineatus TaxID=44033 RepID=A0ABP6A3J7_9ACTN
MTRTRVLAAAAAIVGTTAALLAPATTAHAAGSIHLYRVYYDSPGSDTGSNTSLNAEYVQIHNSHSYAVQLQGYTVRDNAGYTYTFPSYKISAGKTVKVHTGKGTKEAGHLYWGRTWYVWNNTDDKATLRKPSGTIVDTCSYNSSASDYKMC